MYLKLTRFKPYPACWIGHLESQDGAVSLFTLEPPEQGAPHCVPAGTYALVPYDSPTHGDTWCLHNPGLGVYAGFGKYTKPSSGGHDYVELHVGNYPSDSKGCILLGTDWHNGPFIGNSRKAYGRLRKALGLLSEGHMLTICERQE